MVQRKEKGGVITYDIQGGRLHLEDTEDGEESEISDMVSQVLGLDDVEEGKLSDTRKKNRWGVEDVVKEREWIETAARHRAERERRREDLQRDFQVAGTGGGADSGWFNRQLEDMEKDVREAREMLKEKRESDELNVMITGKMTIENEGRSRYYLRSEAKKIENEKEATTLELPLVMRNNQPEYQPWSFADKGAILTKLPHITEGGGRWLNKVLTLTQGHRLALGDMRALLGQVVSAGQLTEIENDAGTRTRVAETPYGNVATAWGGAIRNLFPAPPGAMHNIKFPQKQMKLRQHI
ncbi:hypothetical protein QQF64_000483 [Cirrhinus molitorella]|uniref:Uncharacterized protein n=1 Tax=Cirrhinus molitorella TaxID=172907 RepID=A0ABR3NYV2_9TELE